MRGDWSLSKSWKQSLMKSMLSILTFVFQHEIRHVSAAVARQDGDLYHVTLRDVDEILARVGGVQRSSGGHGHVVPVTGGVDRFTNDRQGATHGQLDRAGSARRRRHGNSHAPAPRDGRHGEVEQAETDRLTALCLHPPRSDDPAASGRFRDEVSDVSRSGKRDRYSGRVIARLLRRLD